MPYNGEGVQALVCALDDMKNSTLVYVDLSRQRVLKCLAYYEEFKSVLARCNQGFDFNAEMSKACVSIGEENYFRLPEGKKEIVALVANLLMEFDRVSMLTFLHMFFPAKTETESFDFFMQGVVEPFKLALVDLVVNGIEETPKVVERTVEFASAGVQQQAEHLIRDVYYVINSASIDDELRSNLSVMLEGFAAALDARDSLMIRAIWLGFKGALEAARLCKKEVAQIDEVLRQYLLSK